MSKRDVERVHNERLALLRLLEAAAMRLVKGLGRDEDPVLRDWAAGVEMEAREFAAVPVVPIEAGS